MIRSLASFLGLLALAGCCSTDCTTEAPAPIRPSRINRTFFENPVSEFRARFESESREVFHHREAIAKTMGLRPGMTVADVGAGTGFYSFLFAQKVSPGGRVYSQDVVPAFVEEIDRAAAESGAPVEGVLGVFTDTRLPQASCDAVFVCDTYHHFDEPAPVLRSIHRALKPGASLWILDFMKIEGWSRPWIMGHVRPTMEQVISEVSSQGFRLVDRPRYLDENYLLHFVRESRDPLPR